VAFPHYSLRQSIGVGKKEKGGSGIPKKGEKKKKGVLCLLRGWVFACPSRRWSSGRKGKIPFPWVTTTIGVILSLRRQEKTKKKEIGAYVCSSNRNPWEDIQSQREEGLLFLARKLRGGGGSRPSPSNGQARNKRKKDSRKSCLRRLSQKKGKGGEHPSTLGPIAKKGGKGGEPRTIISRASL